VRIRKSEVVDMCDFVGVCLRVYVWDEKRELERDRKRESAREIKKVRSSICVFLVVYACECVCV